MTACPLLYQSILANVYSKTTPVEFVLLVCTLNLVYVTPTSVGGSWPRIDEETGQGPISGQGEALLCVHD